MNEDDLDEICLLSSPNDDFNQLEEDFYFVQTKVHNGSGQPESQYGSGQPESQYGSGPPESQYGSGPPESQYDSESNMCSFSQVPGKNFPYTSPQFMNMFSNPNYISVSNPNPIYNLSPLNVDPSFFNNTPFYHFGYNGICYLISVPPNYERTVQFKSHNPKFNIAPLSSLSRGLEKQKKIDLTPRGKQFKYSFEKLFLTDKKKCFNKYKVRMVFNYICPQVGLEKMTRDEFRNKSLFYNNRAQHSSKIIEFISKNRKDICDFVKSNESTEKVLN